MSRGQAAGSIPATSHPAAMASRAVSCPISPRPTTATFAPGPTSAMRSPCKAMDAIVVKAASWTLTHPGTGAQSSPGTAWNSAWFAFPAPPVATSWPGRTPVTARPTSTTTPAAE